MTEILRKGKASRREETTWQGIPPHSSPPVVTITTVCGNRLDQMPAAIDDSPLYLTIRGEEQRKAAIACLGLMGAAKQ